MGGESKRDRKKYLCRTLLPLAKDMITLRHLHFECVKGVVLREEEGAKGKIGLQCIKNTGDATIGL
jgi:hypothetical protein